MNNIIHAIVIGGDTAFDRGLTSMVDGIRETVNPLAAALSARLWLCSFLILLIGIPTAYYGIRRADLYSIFILLIQAAGAFLILLLFTFPIWRVWVNWLLNSDKQEAGDV